jgi:hypothetical protein
MSTRFLPILTLLALSLCSTVSQAQEQELPSLVGRISLAQGDVSLSTDDSDESNAAQVNWPLTSGNELTTGRGARTEFRFGSTSVRLDAESSLEITELDDRQVRLHLHYGSASVRVRNQDVLEGFELTTAQARVLMREVGRVRVDAGRNEDTTMVSVFEGLAQVDGEGDGMTVRAGRSVELNGNDLRTLVASETSFDQWSLQRDRNDERVTATRYVDREMTGYEELDQYGTWRDNREYGAIWSPTSVPAGWAPYRDGRWAYVAPWGWTWIDNSPWGYAPSHYGRWVMISNRWCWTPGRYSGRPIWSPALVGWIGGSNWSLSFNSGHAPAQGWYPLAPRETYVPHYRASRERLRLMNLHALRTVNPEWREHRRRGLSVAPHASFTQRRTIVMGNATRVEVPANALQNAPMAAPPVPQSVARNYDRAQRGERRFEDGPRAPRTPRIIRGQPSPAGAVPPPVHTSGTGFVRPGVDRAEGFRLSNPNPQRRENGRFNRPETPPQPETAPPLREQPRSRWNRTETAPPVPSREQPPSRWSRPDPTPSSAQAAPASQPSSRWNRTERADPAPTAAPSFTRVAPVPAPQTPPTERNTFVRPAPEPAPVAVSSPGRDAPKNESPPPKESKGSRFQQDRR